MATYLLAWNPKRYVWAQLDDIIAQVQAKGSAPDRWSCGLVRNIEPGSRFFLIRLGSEPRGIVGTGEILSAPNEEPHWSAERAKAGETTRGVDILFENLQWLPRVGRDELDEAPFADMKWDTQMSGIRIPDEIASALSQL